MKNRTADREAWKTWDSCVADGDLPTEVPWSDAAKQRKAADWAQMQDAMVRLDAMLTTPLGAGES